PVELHRDGRHTVVHPRLLRCRALGGARGVRALLGGAQRREGEHADADTARSGRQAGAGEPGLRALLRAEAARCAGRDGRLPARGPRRRRATPPDRPAAACPRLARALDTDRSGRLSQEARRNASAIAPRRIGADGVAETATASLWWLGGAGFRS